MIMNRLETQMKRTLQNKWNYHYKSSLTGKDEIQEIKETTTIQASTDKEMPFLWIRISWCNLVKASCFNTQGG